MIPVRLKIKGLYSYQEAQEIDFEQLTAAGMFGIFGSVGSGKSSILEAISYALYGETERLNLKDRRSYNMMNLNSNELLIEFEFISGKKEEKRYKFVVRGKRSGKDFENVGTLARAAYELLDEEWIPLDSVDAARILGLSYENFRRTIIIPQGKFQEFLQLTDTQRTRMLKEIFHLERFELYDQVSRFDKQNQANLQSTRAKIEQIGEVNHEKIDTAEILLQAARSEANKMRQELKQLQETDQAYEQVRGKFLKLEELRQSHQQLLDEKPAMEKLEEKVDLFVKVNANFRDLFLDVERLERDLALEQKAQEEKKKELTLEKAALEAANAEFDLLKVRYEQREKLTQRAHDLETLARADRLSTRIRKDQEERDAQHQKSEALENEVNSLREKLEQQREKVHLLRNNQPNFDLIGQVREWFTVRKNYAENVRETEERIRQSRQDSQEEARKAIQLAGNSGLLETGQGEISLIQVANQLENKVGTADDFIRKTEKEIAQLSVQARLQEFASDLTEGKPCPLCGATHHPHPLHTEASGPQLEKSEQVLEKAKEKRERVQQMLTQIRQAKAISEREAQGVEELQKDLRLKQERLDAHLQRFVWNEFDPNQPQQVEEKAAEARTYGVELKAGEEQVRQLEIDRDRKMADLELLRQGLRRIDLSLSEKKGQLESEKSKVLTFFEASETSGLPEEKEAEAQQLRAEIASLMERYVKQEKELRNLSDKVLRMDQETISKEGFLKNKSAQLDERNQDIELRMERHGLENRTQVREILEWNMEPEMQRRELRDFHNRLTAVGSQVESLKRETADQTYHAAEHEELREKINALRDQVQEKDQSIGKLQNELDDLKERLSQRTELLRQQSRLELRGEDLATLKKLFYKSGFVNYVSTIFLRDLTERANERFRRLTLNKLELVVNEDNSFEVLDSLNGGKQRSVKTLSGGQTFQAALCLALALADNIQEQSGAPRNFFFLDEGFGTLDRESLQIVFETLKALRKENRIVGVISHVEDLQQELSVHLRLKNDEERGSLIETNVG